MNWSYFFCIAATCNGSIREFARHHHLHHTLRCLPPDALSTEDSPPKVSQYILTLSSMLFIV